MVSVRLWNVLNIRKSCGSHVHRISRQEEYVPSYAKGTMRALNQVLLTILLDAGYLPSCWTSLQASDRRIVPSAASHGKSESVRRTDESSNERRSGGFFEIGHPDFVLFEKIVKIGAILSGDLSGPCRLAVTHL